MSNKNSNAGTAADSSTPDEVTSVSQPIANAVVSRSASNFKDEILYKLKQFYDYGNEYGYSNSELSRIRSCISKVEETPTHFG